MCLTAAAKILAAGEALDEVVLLEAALDTIYGVSLRTYMLVDDKDLYHYLFSPPNAADKSVRGAVIAIKLHYETFIDVFGWIKGSSNPAAPTSLQIAACRPSLGRHHLQKIVVRKSQPTSALARKII